MFLGIVVVVVGYIFYECVYIDMVVFDGRYIVGEYREVFV